MNKTLLLICFLVYTSSIQAQQTKSGNKSIPKVEDSTWVFKQLKEYPYPYDTLLSNGYYLKHEVFKDPEGPQYLQHLVLWKDDLLIKEFPSSSFGLIYKNIGYVSADFEKAFVMTYSYGSGNPHRIELVDKASGQVVVTGTWVDADESEEVLLYIENEFETDQQLVLLDIRRNHRLSISDFDNTACAKTAVGGLRSCVKIDTVNNTSIVVAVRDKNEKLSRTYLRKQ